jgi:membrane-bound lytic murein transglycosylase D
LLPTGFGFLPLLKFGHNRMDHDGHMKETEDKVVSTGSKETEPVAAISVFGQIFLAASIAIFIVFSIPSSVRHISPHKIPAERIFKYRDYENPPREPENPFTAPERLMPQINFWKRIFAEFTTDNIIIHDDWYINVIYEVVDMRKPEYSTSRKRREKFREILDHYRRIIAGMVEKWDNPLLMTSDERRICAMLHETPESTRFKRKDAAKRLRLQMGQANSFAGGIARSGAWIGTIKRIFREANLPPRLACLPLIESSFNPYSISFRGASGMWQFMRATGRQYDLKIDQFVDERLDPIRSTHAAVRLLGHNYRTLSSWPLAITAYNHGLAGMNRAVKKTGSRDIADIIEHYEKRSFGFASRNFYAEFIAALHIYEKYETYFDDIVTEPPADYVSFRLPDPIRTFTVEKYFGITMEAFRNHNPGLLPQAFEDGGFIPRGYWLNLPDMAELELVTRYESIPASLKYAYIPGLKRHRVQKGQTLSEIAVLHGTTTSALIRLNNLRNPKQLRAGSYIKLPGKFLSKTNHLKSNRKKKIPLQVKTRHRVKKGQTLSSIAHRYNTSVSRIIRLNAISNPRRIVAGQLLKIPEG